MASSKCLSRQLLKTFCPSCAPQNAFISDSLQQDRDVWARAIKESVILVLPDFPRDKDDQAVDPLWPFQQPFGTPFAAWHHQVENLFEVGWGAPEARPSFCRILYTKPDEQRRRRLTSNKCCTVSFLGHKGGKHIAEHLHINDVLMLLKIQWLNQIHAMPRFEVAAGFLKKIFRKKLPIQF